MHTKGAAAKQLKEKLGIDTCIYLGNDLNDISMFSNALEDNDFIVIANHECSGITDMLEKYLKEECEIKGIEWDNTKLLILEEDNVNNFLHKTSKILGVLNSSRKSQNIKQKYRADSTKKVKPTTKINRYNNKFNKNNNGIGR